MELQNNDFELLSDPNTLEGQKVKIIVKHIRNHWIIINDYHYMLDMKTITYKPLETSLKNREVRLCSFIAQYIENSLLKLDERDLKLLRLKHKNINNICSYNSVHKFIPRIIIELTRDENIFTEGNKIHFKNGYMNLDDLKFYKRQIGVDFTSSCIDYDYTPSSLKDRKWIRKNILNKIISSKEERDFVLKLYGSALHNKFKLEGILFNVGKGSSGKTTLMKLLDSVFTDEYYTEMDYSIFKKQTGSSNDRNKMLNSLKGKNIRYLSVNELDGLTLDKSFFKLLGDGELTTTELYKDGKVTLKIPFVCMTSNLLPAIPIDTGSLRRIVCVNYKNCFAKDEKEYKKYKKNGHL